MPTSKTTPRPTRTSSNPIVEVAEALGLQLEPQGDGEQLVGTCPFADHQGFEVDPKTNTWACKTCQLEGDCLDLVVRVLGVSRRHAKELLKATPLTLAPPSKQSPAAGVPEVTTRRFIESDIDPEDDDPTLLAKVVAFYSRTLKKDDEGLGFLARQGLRNTQLIERFRLGLSNRTLGYRLPRANRKRGAAIRSRLQNLGVLRSTGHEHFNGSLVVPVTDAEGNIVQLYGRKLRDNLRAGTPLHLWLAGKKKPLFNPTAFSFPEVVVAGSVLDALSFLANGVEHVVGLPDLAAGTEELVAAIKAHKTKRVVLAFPRHRAGDEAVGRFSEAMATMDVEVHKLVFPTEMDAVGFARSVGDPKGAFAQLLRNTEWLTGKPAKPNTPTKKPAVITTPTMPIPEVSEPMNEDELVMVFEDRRWRIRGLAENKARGTLKLNLFVSREGVGFHVDRFDIYSARHRSAFTKLAAQEIGVEEAKVKKDLGKVLLAAEQAQDELLLQAREPEPTQVEVTPEERQEALQLLEDPKLLDRVLDDFEKVGVVGETNNLLLGYLVAISRKLAHPLAVIVQSSSAAGKSSLMKAVLSFVPDEDQHAFSAMTGQSLYYVGGTSLRHKVLAIAEEAGAERASYALKLLQSEGVITIASTGKEPGSGRLVSQEYRVEGPVAIFTSTTNIEIDDELLNRCLVLMVDESPEQTARIHAQQRHQMTLQGLLAHEARAEIVSLHQNAQRLLRPAKVVLPDADILSFPDLRVRARRDHRKLLGLVEVVALLHQHQRDVKSVEHNGGVVEFIEATEGDIQIAKKLIEHIGGFGVDDLPPATRRLLEQLDEFVGKEADKLGKARPEIRFTRRQVREALGVGNTQCKVHLKRLVDAEFLLAHRAPHGRGVVYSLAFNGGVHTYDGERSGYGRPLVGPRSAQGRGEVGSRSEGSTGGKEAGHGESAVGASRKRNRPPSQKKPPVRSSRRRKKGGR